MHSLSTSNLLSIFISLLILTSTSNVHASAADAAIIRDAPAVAAPQAVPKAIANELRAIGDLPVRRRSTPRRGLHALENLQPRATSVDASEATSVSVTDHLLTATTTATGAVVSGTVGLANNAVDLSAIIASVTQEIATASDPAAVLASVEALSASYEASLSAALTNTALSGIVASATGILNSVTGGSTAVANATGTSVPVDYSSVPISSGFKSSTANTLFAVVFIGVAGYFVC